ncbi:MAG: O-succinylbenzoic acid--CoA ligase, partial [Prochlorococcaceae cyanobacterium ETNP1_MAG_9]|nr:O-succinylbenzoic acid--CoA ligase [Prochlorococcaceae cyanobacterium ETNP1_MAG_9]
LEIIGRADTAINSGGETIFPEILESKLLAAAKKNQIPIQYILFLPFKDKEWGEKLAGLICWESKLTTSEKNRQLKKIEILLKEWQPVERPCFWQECTALEPTDAGKFERKKWQDWLTINH